MSSQGSSERERAGAEQSALPGSDGEHVLQRRLDTAERARKFYEGAMKGQLTDRMQEFVTDRTVAAVGYTDDAGQPRVAYRSGERGFVRILDDGRVAWREPDDGVGVDLAVVDGDHATLTTLDWWDATVGLHLNGRPERAAELPAEPLAGRSVDRRADDGSTEGGDGDGTDDGRTGDGTDGGEWVVLSIEEAYIHCAKHIPRLEAIDDPGWEPPEAAKRATSLTPFLRKFVENQRLAFLGTADRHGETDVSPRLGPHGFVQVVEASTLAWPEYRGNGVHASLGNVHETGRATLSFLDWEVTGLDVQVQGSATIHDELPGVEDVVGIEKTKSWVELSVDDVSVTEPDVPYVSVVDFDPPWGTDDPAAKKTGYFTE